MMPGGGANRQLKALIEIVAPFSWYELGRGDQVLALLADVRIGEAFLQQALTRRQPCSGTVGARYNN
jgi:hypothetical protein